MNRAEIDALVKKDVNRVIKLVRGKNKRTIPWQMHVVLVGELSKRGLGVREMHRLLAWSLGKISGDLLIAKWLPEDVTSYSLSRRKALKASTNLRDEYHNSREEYISDLSRSDEAFGGKDYQREAPHLN